eukprot:4389978-Amphidinium_carterae.2
MSLWTPSAHPCSKGGSTPAPLHWGKSSRVAVQAPARGPPLGWQGPGAPPGAPGPTPPALAGPRWQTPLEKRLGIHHPRAAARERAQALDQRSQGLLALRLSDSRCPQSKATEVILQVREELLRELLRPSQACCPQPNGCQSRGFSWRGLLNP